VFNMSTAGATLSCFAVEVRSPITPQVALGLSVAARVPKGSQYVYNCDAKKIY
jgi:hypothetical protein